MSAMRDAIRFWEPWRLGYNLALVAQALAWAFLTWPAFRPAVVTQHLPELFVLVLLANLCYCAAYVVDPLLQSASPESRRRRRFGLWIAGTLLALLIAQYWIGDEIYPSVR